MSLLDIKGYAIAAAAGAIIAGAAAGWGAWAIQGDIWRAKLATEQTAHANDLKAVSDTATAAQAQADKDLQDKVKAAAEADAIHFKEMQSAKTENADLRVQLATAVRRVRVPISKTAASGNVVPGNAAASRVDDAAGTAELDPAFAGVLAGIAGDGDNAIIQLKGLQDYVSNVCLKGNVP